MEYDLFTFMKKEIAEANKIPTIDLGVITEEEYREAEADDLANPYL